jgi:serine/threonine-protein kinase
LFDDALNLTLIDWSSDDRYLAYAAGDPAGGEGGIWYRERRPDGSLSEPVSFLRTPANERRTTFSPDHRYLSYSSDESGRNEVYVRPFPGGPGKWQVSTNGGDWPRWSADGKEIFYVEGPAIMAVSVSTSGNFTVGLPQQLFESSEFRSGQAASIYDVFPDGQRFVTIAPAGNGHAPKSVRIVQNWYEEFRDREQD